MEKVTFALGFVQALFNDESSSDVTLVVDGTSFYCHMAVLKVACQYHRFSAWPDKNGRRRGSVVKIDLPEIELPKPFRSCREPTSKAAWFELYLMAVYDRPCISRQSIEEVCALNQIADYMISPDITAACDDILSTLSVSKDKALPVRLFSQKYSLPKALLASKQFVGRHLYELRHDPLLYDIDLTTFKDIALMCHNQPAWQFFIIMCYAAGIIPENDKIKHAAKRIEDPEMVQLCKEILPEISSRWAQETVNMIYETFRRLGGFSFGPPNADSTLLLKLFADCFLRLAQSK
jgi:hypothetical protein